MKMDPRVTLGYVGSICLALCGLPQAIECWQLGYAGISTGTVALWFVGEVATIIYLVWSRIMTRPLALNYGVNILILSVIIFYILFPDSA